MRKCRSRQTGFTMVETMIFVAVSMALFASATAMMRDHQARVDFQYGIQDLSSQLRDVINDVSTGYYERGIECNNVGGDPVLSPIETEQGTNGDCIFIGRVIHFQPANVSGTINNDRVFKVYTAIGVRTYQDGARTLEVTDIDTANPRLITSADAVELVNEHTIPNGIQVGSVTHGPHDSYAFGFFTNFAKYSENSNILETDARNVVMSPFAPTPSNSSEVNVNNSVRSLTTIPPNDGVEICFESRGYTATIFIGGGRSNLGEDIEVSRGNC